MNQRTVLIVEDDLSERNTLKADLALRKFSVEAAGDVATTRKFAKQFKGQLDVVVLDMNLKDRDFPYITGADLGLEILADYREWAPEFIINSKYESQEYYKLALQLRVAAYLHKAKENQRIDNSSLIRHIRALSLRRALSVERPDATKEIHQIAASSRDRSEAMVKFCQEVLAKPFEKRLGAPFFLLLTENNRTQCCAGNADIPLGFDPAYDEIQSFSLAEGSDIAPLVLDEGKMAELTLTKKRPFNRRLINAAFLPLSALRESRLLLGIIQEDTNEKPYAEDSNEMAKILAENLKPVVIEHLLSILTQWAEMDAHRKAVLRATSQFCLYIGQEQLQILQEAQDSGEWQQHGPAFETLRALAADLRDTGDYLLPITEEHAKAERLSNAPQEHQRQISMAEFIKSVWEDVDHRLPEIAFKVTGNCLFTAVPDDLLIIVSRLLQWFDYRSTETPPQVKPQIEITCTETASGPEISFKDRSRRLNEPLRQRLFFPFTQAVPASTEAKNTKRLGQYFPLYLAKMLIEVKYLGILEDRSEKLEANIGHEFIIRFRPSTRHTQGGDRDHAN